MKGIDMKKKIYIMEHLGCANCAAKMEAKFNAHPRVQEAVITFSTKQLRLTAEDPDALIPELQEIARTVEGDIVIIPRESVAKKISYMNAAGSLARRTIPVYAMPVSAGVGVYLDDTTAEEISIPDNEKTAACDFALRVSGNSMEPIYHSGDLVLVEDCDSVEVGELGIFVLDGDGFFKKFGGDRLISLNPEYADILIKNFTEAVCCGRVIGKLKKR